MSKQLHKNGWLDLLKRPRRSFILCFLRKLNSWVLKRVMWWWRGLSWRWMLRYLLARNRCCLQCCFYIMCYLWKRDQIRAWSMWRWQFDTWRRMFYFMFDWSKFILCWRRFKLLCSLWQLLNQWTRNLWRWKCVTWRRMFELMSSWSSLHLCRHRSKLLRYM